MFLSGTSRANISRRSFCCQAALLLGARPTLLSQTAEGIHFNVAEYDRKRILASAAEALKAEPVTITSIQTPAKLEPGLYYSEDTEWWRTDNAAYEHRQGYTNPSAFTAHRDAMVAMNGHVASLVAAWRLTSEAQYATQALRFLHAWFLDDATRMTPSLDHAACVPPSFTGKPGGVEETVMLTETARAASFLCAYNGVATEEEANGLRKWFAEFALWLNESKPGFIARESKDRLAICWTAQTSEFARFARNEALLIECSHRFRDKLLRQMSLDGNFPTELHRPNSYAASIFTLDCLSVACEVLSSPMERLWDYNLPDGRGMRSAVSFLFPALLNRGSWKYPADVEHFNELPVRQPSLLFAGRAYSRPEYIDLWKHLPAEPKLPQMLRRFPVREPALWTVRAPA
jgi:hypothetical protein